MSRYIDADKMSVYFEALANMAEAEGLFNLAHINKRYLRLVEEAPTADVVEVVRCKDCKYSEIDENGNLWCAFYNGKIREMPNGYCWHGERKEE